MKAGASSTSSDSIGDLEFAPDGYLIASGGDGASFVDGRQGAIPALQRRNRPYGDPPDEGGALRSQDPLTTADPTGYDGSIIRIDPATGAAAPGNPLASSADVDARRLIAYGLRNPFRFEFRPGTADLYIGDVGWNTFEEVNRIATVPPPDLPNFGWPCFEGNGHQPDYDALNVPLCEGLYSAFGPAGPAPPFFAYGRVGGLHPGDPCSPEFGASLSGLAFYTGSAFPDSYKGALLFADAARGCIWSARAGAGGVPDFTSVTTLAARDANPDLIFDFNPVDVTVGPDGAVYLPDFFGAGVARIRYFPGNAPPQAAMTADPMFGPVPLDVTFDAAATTDADGDPLTFSWDLNGDSVFGDATGPKVARRFTASANVTVSLRVSDPAGATDVATVSLHPGDVSRPRPVIDSPDAGTKFGADEEVVLRGHAYDPQDPAANGSGNLPSDSLRWVIILEHCPDACHAHPLYTLYGETARFNVPAHENPSRLFVRLIAADSRRLEGTATRRFDLEAGGGGPNPPPPGSVRISVASRPAGALLRIDRRLRRRPIATWVNPGTRHSVAAQRRFRARGRLYAFHHWTDRRRRVHRLYPVSRTALVAVYRQVRRR